MFIVIVIAVSGHEVHKEVTLYFLQFHSSKKVQLTLLHFVWSVTTIRDILTEIYHACWTFIYISYISHR